ncbi:DUF2244 domain-containing protein [Alteromonas sp. ASW11-19]|uniref:DUF2244 domain-containing protein n=1 Tax=Alteromonas salexigens TaxID=2982530 RepID=A0ABT2VRP6_9ALTE|nr:DUF2244 domain-containing protein [Alteromonas salexigens]MCU7555985.1 DUF2244 domain-containing protein [Alteromonas salexigens]
MIITRTSAEQTDIRLYPNRSATWGQTKWLILAMSAVLATVATGWLIAGVWVILPFAGIEIGLLAYLFYRVSHFTYQYQAICISADRVLVSLSKRSPDLIFVTSQCHVEFLDGDTPWHQPVIILVGATQRIEIGQFLNHADRQQLKQSLATAGLIICRKNWWKND